MMKQKITAKCFFYHLFDIWCILFFFCAHKCCRIAEISRTISNLNIGYLFALFYNASHYKLCWNNIEFFYHSWCSITQYQIFHEYETSISFCARIHDSLDSPGYHVSRAMALPDHRITFFTLSTTYRQSQKCSLILIMCLAYVSVSTA